MLAGAGADRFFLPDRHGFQEGHQRAQLGTHFLDDVRALFAPLTLEPLAARRVFVDPAARVLAAPDLVEHLLHLFLRFGGHDARTAGVVAMLGGVTYRIPHVAEAALVN